MICLYTAAVLRWPWLEGESAVLRCDFWSWLERGREDAGVRGRENQIIDIKQMIAMRLRR